MSEKILFYFDDIFLKHETGAHPENKNRLIWINTAIDNSSLKDKVERRSPRAAKREDILRVHTEDHVALIEKAIDQGAQYLDADTVISPDSLEAAYKAAGAGLDAADEIMKGEFSKAFLAVRPPGHHAEAGRAMGFCLFNNIAVTAKYLQEVHKLKKILILDWDVHHGNGTERSFYNDDTVMFISLHQYPHYPGTGPKDDIGEGKGEGYNLNFPMRGGSSDEDYFTIFNEEIVPAIKNFAPDFILISAGFDAHERDMLSGVRLSSEAYGEFTRLIKSAADSANGRIISFLEGGYEPIGLTEGVLHHLLVL